MRRRPAPLLAAALVLALSGGSSGDTPAGDVPAVLISRQLAEDRDLHTGDLVRLSAEPSGRDARLFRIAGVYEPVPDPMRFAQSHFEARLHLPDLLSLRQAPARAGTGADTVDQINVALADPSTASAFAREASARLPGTVVGPINAPDQRTSTFAVIERFHLAIAIVSVTGGAVFLLALMVMLVDERRDVIGMLRLIGFTRRRILLQIVAEGALITIAGTAAGLLFAVATQGLFNRYFQWRYDTALVFLRVTPAVAAQSTLIALPLGMAASLVASWTFLRRGLLGLVRR
jgi:ABC-type lipoprotein release transport system permease subunit